MLFTFTPKKLIHPPEDISTFVDNLIKRLTQEGLYYQGPDRRREPRHAVAIQMSAIPLDDGLQPVGNGFVATTRDISSAGISLIHFDRLDCPFLAVEIAIPRERSFQAAVEVLRCRPIGPYFEVAGKFVTKLYKPVPKAGLHITR